MAEADGTPRPAENLQRRLFESKKKRRGAAS
jgi:hypothetical protein